MIRHQLTDVIALFPLCVRCGRPIQADGEAAHLAPDRPNRVEHDLCADLEYRRVA